MKKVIGLALALAAVACTDECTGVVDGTETAVDCQVTSTDTVTSTDVGAAVQQEVNAGN